MLWENSTSKGRNVEQYDMDGNFIKTWYSTKEISNTLDISLKQTSSILSCCKGNQKQHLDIFGNILVN